jgi:hypothetical protein
MPFNYLSIFKSFLGAPRCRQTQPHVRLDIILRAHAIRVHEAEIELRQGLALIGAAVRGAILGSAAEGKTIAAKRGSRGALELWPTIEQGTNWPLNLVPVYNFLSGQIQASLGERVLPFHVNVARTPSASQSRACFVLCVHCSNRE